MKKLIVILLVLSSSTWVTAQSTTHDWGISFKNLFLDYQSQNGGSVDAIRNYHHGFEIGVQRRLQENVFLSVPLSYGKVNAGDNYSKDRLHKDIIGLDGQIQYQFLKDSSMIIPYFMGGIGAVMEIEGDFNIQAPIGVGAYFKAGERMYVNWQSEYRFSFSPDRNNLHHAIGFVYMLGPKGEKEEKPEPVEEGVNDMDGDGIEDDMDLCPKFPGSKELNGCPDSDGDGIADFQDKCPNEKGPKIMMGCPDSDGDGVDDSKDKCPDEIGTPENDGCPIKDSDGDGVTDDKDKCPDIVGLATNDGCPNNDNDNDGISNDMDECPDVAGSSYTKGCPDTDGDGIADKDDKCPELAGPRVYGGCPDTDGDGLDDSIDRCPNSPGTVAGNGCPEIKKEDRETLDIAMRAVQFDTGRNTLKSESYQILKQIANILSRYPDYNLSIAGHTDNVGNAVANQTLSERRAKACYDYLISQGISSNRMSHTGYGESRPISDNNTLNGKRLNRRVEFNLIPR